MDSSISAIVANLCMEVIEAKAIQNETTSLKIWKRFVDDSFPIMKTADIPSSHNTLNSVDPFRIEHKKGSRLSFFDTSVCRHNNTVTVDVFVNLFILTNTWIS